MPRRYTLNPRQPFLPVRYKLEALRSHMAWCRTCSPGGGGHWDGRTGDGEAWHKVADVRGPWYRVRAIKAGQWAGPWRYKHQDRDDD